MVYQSSVLRDEMEKKRYIVIIISSLPLYIEQFFGILSLCVHPSVLCCPFECNKATIICQIM